MPHTPEHIEFERIRKLGEEAVRRFLAEQEAALLGTTPREPGEAALPTTPPPTPLPIQPQPPTTPLDLSGIEAPRYWPAVRGWGKDIALGIANLLSAPALGAYPSKVAPDKRKALEPTLEAFKAFEELMAPAAGQITSYPPWVTGLNLRNREAVIARHDALVAKGLDEDSAWAGAWQTSKAAGEIPWYQVALMDAVTDPSNPLLFGAPSAARAAARAGLKEFAGTGAGAARRGAVGATTPPMTQALAVQPKPFQVQPALGQIDPTQVIPPGPSALDFLGRPIVPERAPLGLETRGQVTPFVERGPIPLPGPTAAARPQVHLRRADVETVTDVGGRRYIQRPEEPGSVVADIENIGNKYLVNRDDLPETIYHVTTNPEGIRESGMIFAITPQREALQGVGLGGLPRSTVSFTASRKIAETLQRELVRLGEVARTPRANMGNIILKFAKEDEVLAGLSEGAITQSSSFTRFMDDYVRPGTSYFEGNETINMFRTYHTIVRDRIAPSLDNPLFTLVNKDMAARITPESVKIIRVSKNSIPNEALIRRQDFLDEVEVFADVPVTRTTARVGDAPPLTAAGQRARLAKTFTIGFENTLAIREGQLQAARQEVRNIEAKIAAAPRRADVEEQLINLTSEVDAAHTKLSSYKRPNSAIANKELDKLEAQGIEVDDARGLIEDYKDIGRSDFDWGVDGNLDYAEARKEAWDEVLKGIENLDAEEVLLPRAAAPATTARVSGEIVDAQLAAARAAEEKAIVALRDVESATRGRIAKEALAKRDEELGRVIAPTEELIPGTGITSDTFPYPAGSVLKGLKYPLRHYTDGSLRRMAKGKTERARFYAAELAKREAEEAAEAAEAAGSLARREAGEAVRDFPTAVGSPRQPRAQFPEVVIEEAVPTARGTGPTPTTAPVTRGADAPITPVTPVVAREVAGEIPTTPTGPTTVRVGEGVAEAMPVTPAATQEALVARLIQVIRGAKRLAAPTARAISRERARRGRNIESALASTGGPEGRRRAFGAAKGEIEVPTFEPPAGAFTPAEGEILQEMIRTRFMNDGYDWMPTQTAFEKLFAGGRIPAPHEIQLLEEVFGPELIQAVLTQRSKGKKAFELFIEIWNVPKALKASYDLSATLRQGAYLLMEGKPAKDAFKAQLKAVRSKKGFDEVNEAIVANEWYARAVNWGLDMTLPRKGRGLLGREEEFIGAELAKRIPIIGRGVKLSERAYTAFLNKMRMDTFTKYAKDLDRMGATEAEFKKLASSINIMTGRGELGPLTEAAMILNLPFFSPRFFISRFQLLGTLATKNPVLARMAAKNIVGYIGFVTSMLSLAHFSGVGRVEWDSRSSDFGKLRIKGTNTRLDPFAGVQQAVVFVTHLFGKRKVTGTGEIVNVDPREATGYFLENKLSPSAATSLSLKRGKLRFDKEFTPFNILYELLAPIPIGDVWDAIDDAGPLLGSALGAYAVAGGGVQTFGFPDWQEDFKPYFKIPTDPLERRIKGTRGNREEYRKNNPEVDAKLWITGAVTTLKTDAAASYAKAFVQEHGIDPTTIKAVKEYQEKTKRLTEAGLDRGRVTWQRKVHNEFIREILAEEAAPMPTGTRTPTAPAPTAEFERIRKLGEEAVRRFLAEEVGAPR